MSYYDRNYQNVNVLLGKTLVRIEGAENGSDSITFHTSEGEKYTMLHIQDCCENVAVESIVGDVEDLIGEPLLLAEEVQGETPNDYKFDYEPESYTWTFYKFATRKGYVDIRWLGSSNGYYGEGVDFVKDN